MKKIILGLTLFCLSTIYVANIEVTGTVDRIRTHNVDKHPYWKPPIFWFTFKEVSQAISCHTWNGKVLITAKSEAAYSMVLAAKMSNKKLNVQITNEKLQQNHSCTASFIDLF